MLAAMIEAWEAWLLIVGLAIGAATTAVLLVRLPRGEDDIDAFERRAEAAWIADTIERYGGVAPTSLVEEVLDLHQAYLRVQRPPQPRSRPAAPSGAPPGYATAPGYPPPPAYPPPPGPAAPPPPDGPQIMTPPRRR